VKTTKASKAKKPAKAKPTKAKAAKATPTKAKPAKAQFAKTKPAKAKPPKAKRAKATPANAKPKTAKPAPKATSAREVPALLAAYFAANRWKELDGKTPPWIPMFSAQSQLTLKAVKSAAQSFGDRDEVTERHQTLWPLAWLHCEGHEENAFIAVDGSTAECPVVTWWPESGKLVPMAASIDAYVKLFSANSAKDKRPMLEQLVAAFRAADKLSDANKNEEGLVALDEVLARYDFTPTREMSLADDLIEKVGECYRLRGTIHVLGPPYARETALADSERDFRTAVLWHSLGMSTPGYAYIGLCETLGYETGDYAKAIVEADRALGLNRLASAKAKGYPRFFITKVKAYSQLASGDVNGAKTTFATLLEQAGDDARYRAGLVEDFEKLDEKFPQHMELVKDLREKLAA
jgi:hypothetical protein